MSTYNPTWETPKTDRTKEDTVYAAYLNNKGDYDYLNDYNAYLGEDSIGEDVPLSNNREITDWDAGLPGALTKEDYTRVNGNIYFVAKKLDLKKVSVWNNFSLTPVVATFELTQNGIQAIYDAYHLSTTPEPPEMPYNTWDKWNAIEQIIYDAYTYSQNRTFPKCGNDVFCGEEGILI